MIERIRRLWKSDSEKLGFEDGNWMTMVLSVFPVVAPAIWKSWSKIEVYEGRLKHREEINTKGVRIIADVVKERMSTTMK